VEVHGIKVFYREAGPAAGPPILLLHGFPATSHMFRDLMPRRDASRTPRPPLPRVTRSVIHEEGKNMTELNTVNAPLEAAARTPTEDTSIRPFRVNVSDEALTDLRRRILATRWPDKETVADRSQGAQLAMLQELVQYWGSGYDWRKAEAKLNALPQFMTSIDGVDIHFIHVRSRHGNALPVIITHGWPGSVFEQIKLIGPLTDPTKYGGRAEDAFDVVIPSLPGFGFSARPRRVGGWSASAMRGASS
jgi:pimeloyl-ACP methyl ester carboxylesterase